jgi:hypothetical protein
MTTSNSEDSRRWVSNPPSTIVKVVGTTREDINNKLGIVVQYNTDRGRYVVHLTKSQQVVAMKPDNLAAASMLEKGQAYFKKVCRDPQMHRKLTNLTVRLPPINISVNLEDEENPKESYDEAPAECEHWGDTGFE